MSTHENRAVEAEVQSAVVGYLAPFLEKFHEPPVIWPGGDLVISGVASKEDGGRTLVLRLVYDHERRLAFIPNIFMQHQQLGKCTIALIRDTLAQFGYQLFVTDLVAGFYRRLVARGATIIEEGETVLITSETKLSGEAPSVA